MEVLTNVITSPHIQARLISSSPVPDAYVLSTIFKSPLHHALRTSDRVLNAEFTAPLLNMLQALFC